MPRSLMPVFHIQHSLLDYGKARNYLDIGEVAMQSESKYLFASVGIRGGAFSAVIGGFSMRMRFNVKAGFSTPPATFLLFGNLIG